MTEETQKYGTQWQAELRAFAQARAQHDKFPREFPFASEEAAKERVAEMLRTRQQPSNRDSFDSYLEKLSNCLSCSPEAMQGMVQSIQDENGTEAPQVFDEFAPLDAEESDAALEARGITEVARNQILQKVRHDAREQIKQFLKDLAETSRPQLADAIKQTTPQSQLADAIQQMPADKQAPAEEFLQRLIGAIQKVSEIETTEKIATAIDGAVQRVPSGRVVVLIGGGGSSGKTTFTKRLKTYLRRKFSQHVFSVESLDVDSYFFPLELVGNRASDGKYDNPLNSYLEMTKRNIQAIQAGDADLLLPVHDRQDHKLERQTYKDGAEIKPLIGASVVIVEGLYTLGPIFKDIEAVRIYIDASPLDRAKGRVWRDINVRGRSERHVVEMLLGREAYHQMFVEPTRAVADYVVKRTPTGGTLKVVYETEEADCLKRACQEAGIKNDDLKKVLDTFAASKKRLNDRRRRQTDF